MLIIFRGMAGCGKSTLAREVSHATGVPLVGKDDVFGVLVKDGLSVADCNRLSFDILADICGRALADKSTFIVEVALPHRAHMEIFVSRLNAEAGDIKILRCVCSDREEWRRRIEARIISPKPHEIFPSFEDMLEHYSKADTSMLEGEDVVDTARPLSECVEKALGIIKSAT